MLLMVALRHSPEEADKTRPRPVVVEHAAIQRQPPGHVGIPLRETINRIGAEGVLVEEGAVFRLARLLRYTPKDDRRRW